KPSTPRFLFACRMRAWTSWSLRTVSNEMLDLAFDASAWATIAAGFGVERSCATASRGARSASEFLEMGMDIARQPSTGYQASIDRGRGFANSWWWPRAMNPASIAQRKQLLGITCMRGHSLDRHRSR